MTLFDQDAIVFDVNFWYWRDIVEALRSLGVLPDQRVDALHEQGIDPFTYLRDALPGLFALGEKPTTEQLLDWFPDRWLLNRTRNTSLAAATAGQALIE